MTQMINLTLGVFVVVVFGREEGRNRARGKNISGLFSLKIMYTSSVLAPCNLFSLHSEGH